ncbi:MAG: hypothetical protein Q9191_005010, partial [Dirinaria sp. TL-2023a]
MSVGFGFSVSDIVIGLKLIKQSIEALQDTKGSSADFRALTHEIDSLRDGLEAVEDLKLDQQFGPKSKQAVAIRQAVSRCRQCIETFLSTIAKYQPCFRTKIPARATWKANLKKIQWALCKQDDVNRFRAQLERHSSSISMLLVTLQVSQSFEQCTPQAPQHPNTMELRDQKQDMHFDQTTSLLRDLTLDQRQMFLSLLESNRQLIQANELIAYELQQIRGAVQLHYDIPPQVALQKPVTLLDACGNVCAFHLDFVSCAQALLAVLKIRFQQHGVQDRGLQMLDDSQFVLEDFKGKLDLAKPWSQIMKPGQKIDMSMIFHRGVPWNICPGCRLENEVDFESQTECARCGLYYRRVQERILRPSENESRVIRPAEYFSVINGRRRDRYSTSPLVVQFRRVQLVYTYLPNEVEKAVYSETFTSEEPRITDFWSREERTAFHNLISTTGTNWQLMSERMGTKSATQ